MLPMKRTTESVLSVPCDSRYLVVSVQVADLGQEFLDLIGFLHTNAVGNSVSMPLWTVFHADQFGSAGVPDECLIKEIVEGQAVGTCTRRIWFVISRANQSETRHARIIRLTDHRPGNCQQIEPGTDRHADRHREEDKAHIARLFDGIAKANEDSGRSMRTPGDVRPTIIMTSATTMLSTRA